MRKVFDPANKYCINIRNSYLKFTHPFLKTNMGQNILSYMGLSVWHCTPDHFKEIRNMKMFREKGKNDQYLLRNFKNLKELIEFKILKITMKQLSYPIVQTNIFSQS